MIKKILALIVAIAMTLALVLGSPVASSAGTLRHASGCSDDKSVCMALDYQYVTADAGFSWGEIVLWCDPDHWALGWDDVSVDGHSLVAKNAGGKVFLNLGDSGTNIRTDANNCHHYIDVPVYAEKALDMYITYNFTEQLNLQHDTDDSITIHLSH